MTDKEFRKLSRQDLLRLLRAQGEETEALRRRLTSTQGELRNEPETEMESISLDMIRSEPEQGQYKNRYKSAVRNTIFSLLAVAAAAALLAVLLLPVLQITGGSMMDTLYDEDIVVALNGSKYEAGDVVAFYYNNDILIKRVIANAGDWVNIDEEGNVYVNDGLLEEPYIDQKALGECNITLPYQVPVERIFVMGDHRSVSIDSRNTAVGCISKDLIIGKILFRVWPLARIGFIK